MAFFNNLRSPREKDHHHHHHHGHLEEKRVLNPVGPLMRSTTSLGRPLSTSSVALTVGGGGGGQHSRRHSRKSTDASRRASLHSAIRTQGTESDTIRPSTSAQDITRLVDFGAPISGSGSQTMPPPGQHHAPVPLSIPTTGSNSSPLFASSPRQQGAQQQNPLQQSGSRRHIANSVTLAAAAAAAAELTNLRAEKEAFLSQLDKQRKEKQKVMEQLWKLWDKNMQLEQQMEEAQKRYEDLLRKMSQPSASPSYSSIRSGPNDEMQRLADYYGAWSRKSSSAANNPPQPTEPTEPTESTEPTSPKEVLAAESQSAPCISSTSLAPVSPAPSPASPDAGEPMPDSSQSPPQQSSSAEDLQAQKSTSLSKALHELGKTSSYPGPTPTLHELQDEARSQSAGYLGCSTETPFRELLTQWNQKSSMTNLGALGRDALGGSGSAMFSPSKRKRSRNTSITDQFRQEKAKQLQQFEDRVSELEQELRNAKRRLHLQQLNQERNAKKLGDAVDMLEQIRNTMKHGANGILFVETIHLLEEIANEMELSSATPVSTTSNSSTEKSPKHQSLEIGTSSSGVLKRRSQKPSKGPREELQAMLKRTGSLQPMIAQIRRRSTRAGGSGLVASSNSMSSSTLELRTEPESDYGATSELPPRKRSNSEPTKHSWELPVPRSKIDSETGFHGKETTKGLEKKPKEGRLSYEMPSSKEIDTAKEDQKDLSPQKLEKSKSGPTQPSTKLAIPLLLLAQKEPSTELLDALRKEYEFLSPKESPSSLATGPITPRRRELIFSLTEEGKPALKAGSKNSIITWLIEKNTEIHNLLVFLDTFRVFTTPMEVLEQLAVHFPPSSSETPRDERIQRRAAFILKEWIARHYEGDFKSNTQLMERLNYFLNEEMPRSGVEDLAMDFRVMIHQIETERADDKHSVSGVETPKKAKPTHHAGLSIKTPRGLTSGLGRMDFLSISALEAAKQLTLIEHDMFRSINSFDCIRKSDGVAPSIKAFIDRFNHVSQWISTEIVMTPNSKQRVAVLKRFITIAKKCLEMNNFNTLLEITSGLNSADVQRLKSSWRSLPSKYIVYFEELEDLMAPKRNFKSYRDALKLAPLPALPYFGIYLRDMTFIDEGNHDYVQSEMINFEKMSLISGVLREMETFQRARYDIQPNPVLQNYFKNLLVLPEATRYHYSKLCEPRAEEVGW